MENSLKMLTMAAGIFITCMVIGFSLLVLREGKEFGNSFIQRLQEEERNYVEMKWTKYDGNLVSGAEVINVIRQFQDEMEINVNNLIENSVYSPNNPFKLMDNNSENGRYIEPFDEYEGSIMRNENGEIYRLIFRKRE